MKHTIILFLCAVTFQLFAQQSGELYTIVEYPAVPGKYCDMEERMEETSGVIFFDGAIWSINDSGNEPELYKIDKAKGTVIQTVIVENGTNRDWEDLTQDEHHIYIGDFGNNRGNRTDLKIYKIAKKEFHGKKRSSVKAEIIHFTYKDQTVFDENKKAHNFDCEAVISYGDSLIIFTKNWENGKTKMYKLPKTAGAYELDVIATFDVDGLITGADFNSKTGDLALIGYKEMIPFIFYFKNFNGRNFDSDLVFRFNLNRLEGSQAEGIAWLNGETVVFSTEKTKTFVQQAFELNLQTVLKLLPK